MVIDWILPFCFVEQQQHHSFITKCLSVYITPCMEIREVLACGIRDIFAFGIWNPGLWNPVSGIPLTIRLIQNPSFTDKESGSTTWNPESKTILVYPKWGCNWQVFRTRKSNSSRRKTIKQNLLERTPKGNSQEYASQMSPQGNLGLG